MFKLNNLRSDDRLAYSRIESFLLTHPDPGVRIRPNEQLDAALDTGQGLMIERDGMLVAVSLVYKFADADGPVYSELGTMRVVANGFGLQSFLAWLHVFQLGLEEYPQCLEGTFAVVSSGTASEHVLTGKVGMKEWSPPAVLRHLRSRAQVPFDPSKKVLRAEAEAWATACLRLRELHVEDRVFRTPKGDAKIELLTGWFDPRLLDAEF